MGFGDFVKKIGSYVPNPFVQAGAAIVGDAIGADASRDAVREANAANREIAERNLFWQQQFAQHGVRWRTEDALRAGIHPLVAMGASVPQFSPSGETVFADSSRGDFARSTGQNLSRAFAATMTAEEKQMASLRLAAARAELDSRLMDNTMKAIELKRLQSGTPFPSMGTNFIPGQGDALVQDFPLKRTISQPGSPQQEAGWRPDVAFTRTSQGFAPVMPESIAESMESNPLGSFLWFLRNQVLPNFVREGSAPSKNQLPPGYDFWAFDKFSQEWVPRKGGRRSLGREIWEKFRFGR